MHPFFQFLSALTGGVTVSRYASFGQEVAAGGTTNKIWTGFVQLLLIMVSFKPLYLIFPAASLTLNILYYSSIACTGLLTYLASVCHMNQVELNVGDKKNLQKLPFGLHENAGFRHSVIFLNKSLTYLLYGFYASVLGMAVFHGYYLFAAASASMITLDQLYQHRWFPSILETPYILLNSCLYSTLFFGYSSPFSIALSAVSAVVVAWDYVQTHLRGARSASSQFAIGLKDHEWSFDKTLSRKPTNKKTLDLFLENFITKPIRITFNHFRAASVITDQILGKAKKMNFTDYSQLFNQIDFKNPTVRTLIQNEMVIHDKFNEKTLDERRGELNLSPETEPVDVQIAFLKREMTYVVARLNNPSYKALNHQQINTLVGQAQLILENTLAMKDEQKKQSILLTLAIRTGSHCYRMYLETFAELFHAHVATNQPLSLREKAALAAQSVREDEFKKYYYKIRPFLRQYYAATYDLGYLLLEDKNDYHAYELFANDFGAAFYLQNESLSRRFRGLYRIVDDYINTYIFFPLLGAVFKSKCLFSDYYNDECLIDAAVDGKGKLHLIFQEWCNAVYPEAYMELLLDEDLYPVDKKDPKIRAMAKLMLLDLNLVELTEPFKNKIEAVSSTYDKLCSMLGYGKPAQPVHTPLATNNYREKSSLFSSCALDNCSTKREDKSVSFSLG